MSNKRFRKRNDESSSESDDAENELSRKNVIETVRQLQNLRKRPPGLTIGELATGKEYTKEIPQSVDPFKLKVGGMIDLKKIKPSDVKHADVEEGIRRTFSKESQLRDEDEEMRKYVEEQMLKRKGIETNNENKTEKIGPADQALQELSDRLKMYQSKTTEDMLSNQMLCGIPEVDLGLEHKMKAVEQTEAAKARLFAEAIRKKRTVEETLVARKQLLRDIEGDFSRTIFDVNGEFSSGSDLLKPDDNENEEQHFVTNSSAILSAVKSKR
ncbi:Uncharacterized protein T4E_11665 [Trichinella pseudospiralis]|uniref:Uncharacterized protein n=2 Tax=Trichinella pseudospiralis TaxID=6337 RepID=A0A0V1FC61_TRIPS|nr:Uncharacterized protein T4E_11665 [Trichinella pseudospiralis]KRY83550.1 Uncharacterized protein T4D_7011 [Trichinella pseudospiralis]